MSALDELLPILAELSEDPSARRSLAELARLANRSSSYFQRAFSRVARESPKQYTRRLQLEYAAVQLLTLEDSVLDIALASGFESHEGFTRAFTQHFALPPKDFRKRSAQSPRLQAELITQIGPCLRLYRATTRPTPGPKESPMNYDITVQTIPEVTFLFKTMRCAHAQVSDALAQMLPAAFQHAMQAGLQLAGPPMSCYVEWGPGMTTIEGGAQLGPVEAPDLPEGLALKVLPETRAAVTVHTGPYDALGEAHAAMEVYLQEQGLKAGGAPREIYLTDPGQVPDPKDWKTQIIWPIA